MQRGFVPIAAAALVLLAGIAPSTAIGQTLNPGDFVTTAYGSKTVFSVTPAGVVTTVYSGSPLVQPSGIAVSSTPEILVSDYAGTIYRIPSPNTIAQVVAGLKGPIRLNLDQNGDILVTELTARTLLRVKPGGGISTIHAGAPFVRPFGVVVDGNGDYLVVDDSVDALFRIAPGGVSTVYQGPPFLLPQNVAHFRNGDYAVVDGVADSLFRVPSGGGSPATVVSSPPLGNPEGVVYDFEDGVVISESGAPSGDRIVRVSSRGVLSIVAQGAPFSNLEDVARIPYLSGPNLGQPGQKITMLLRIPADAGLPYLTFASFSIYPGFGLPAPDVRGTPLNPDALFFLTLGANNAVFINWTGNISAPGQAAPILSVPNVPLPAGLTIFVQALTLDASSRSGIRTISNVHTIRF